MKRQNVIVSEFVGIDPERLDSTETNEFHLFRQLYPFSASRLMKYERDANNRLKPVAAHVPASAARPGLGQGVKQISILRRKCWDRVFFFAPDQRMNRRDALLSLLLWPRSCYCFNQSYQASRMGLGRRLAAALASPRHGFMRVLAHVSRKLRLSYNLGRPTTAIIENTNICDQKCPICETGLGILERPRGRMGYENFCKLIDHICGFVRTVEIYYMGEPMLDPDIYRMIRYAKDKHLRVKIATNGNFLDIDRLFWSGLDNIDFKMSGMDQAAHDRYRVGGSLDNVIRHVRQILEERRKRGVLYPRVGLGFIVMKHNEHQTDEFRKFARELGVDDPRLVKTCIRTHEQGQAMLPTDRKFWLYDEQAFAEGRIEPKWKPRNECGPMYHQVIFTWEGDMLPCCRDCHGHHRMGNIFKARSFNSIWNGKAYREFRKQVLTRQRQIQICSLCQEFATYD